MQEAKRISLLAIDLDDTLLDDTWCVSEVNKGALQALAASGVQICIVSGRMPGSMIDAISGLSFVRYIACYHGALIRDIKSNSAVSGRTILDCPITLSGFMLITSWAMQNGYRIMYFEGNSVVAEAEDPVVAYYRKRTGAKIYVQPRSIGEFEVHKLLVYDPSVSYDITQESQSELVLYSQAQDLKPPNTRFFKTGLGYIEFTHSDATKSSALESLCSILGLSLSSSAAIGDSYNDLDMIEAAGVSFAVSNAVPVVQAAATHIVASNTENGVAQAVQIILELNELR